MDYFKGKCSSKSPIQIAGMVVFGMIAITGFAALFGFVIMWLWNALMPDIFGLTMLTYWQSVGILILAKLLFGGFGSGHKRGARKHHKFEKRNFKRDASKWELYDKFWQEEGDAAYQEFVKRNTENQETGSDATSE